MVIPKRFSYAIFTWRCLALFVLYVTTVLSTTTALAQNQQYSIVLDDSGSMGNPDMKRCRNCNPGNDPNRLAVYAIHALISSLPDDAEVGLMTLGNNGIASSVKDAGFTLPTLGPLSSRRDTFRRLLTADATRQGELTKHDLTSTPCENALDGLLEQLNNAWRNGEGDTQTAIFLNDGTCTGKLQSSAALTAAIEDFRSKLQSEQAAQATTNGSENARTKARPFRFYLVCLGTEGCSQPFKDLAVKTEGNWYEVKEPAELASAFGEILGRSQNVCPQILDKKAESLPDFAGARAVQLMLISQRNKTATLRSQNVHAFRHVWGTVFYDFAATLWPASPTPISQVVNADAGSSWQLLAIPQYRGLKAVLRIYESQNPSDPCNPQSIGKAVKSGSTLRVGAGYCIGVSVQDDRDTSLRSKDLNRKITGTLSIGDKTAEITIDGAENEYRYPIPSIEPAEYGVAAELRLGAECLGSRIRSRGNDVVLRSNPFNVVAKTVVLSAVLNRDADGPIIIAPNDRKTVGTLKLTGNFPREKVAISVVGEKPHESPHQCVQVEIKQRKLPYAGEEPFVLSRAEPGSGYTVNLVTTGDCGFDRDDESRTVALMVQYPGGDQQLEFSYRIDNELNLSAADDLTLVSGKETRQITWGPTTNQKGERRYHARLRMKEATVDGDRKSLPRRLRLELLTPADGATRSGKWIKKKKEDQHQIEFTIGGNRTGAPVVLRGQAQSCCSAGEWVVPIELLPISADGSMGLGTYSDVVIRVEPSGWWNCWGPRILLAILLFLLFVTLRAIWIFFTRVHLLPTAGKGLPAIDLLVHADEYNDDGDGYKKESEPVWSWKNTRNQQGLGSVLGRRVRVVTHAMVDILLKGKHGYETVRTTPQDEFWNTPVFTPDYVRTVLGDLPLDAKPGLYLQAQRRRGLIIGWVTNPNYVLTTKLGIDDVRENLRADAAYYDDAARSVVVDNDFYLIRTDAHRRKPSRPFGFHVHL